MDRIDRAGDFRLDFEKVAPKIEVPKDWVKFNKILKPPCDHPVSYRVDNGRLQSNEKKHEKNMAPTNGGSI